MPLSLLAVDTRTSSRIRPGVSYRPRTPTAAAVWAPHLSKSSPSSTADTSLPDLASGSSGHASSAAAPTSPQALVEPAALPGRSNLTNGAAGQPLTPVYSFRPDDFSPLPKGIKDPIKDAEKPYWDSEFVLGFLSGSSKSQKMVNKHIRVSSASTSATSVAWEMPAVGDAHLLQLYRGADDLLYAWDTAVAATSTLANSSEFAYYRKWRRLFSRMTPDSWALLDIEIPEDHLPILRRLMARTEQMMTPKDRVWRGLTLPAPRVAVLNVGTDACCKPTVIRPRTQAEIELEMLFGQGAYGAAGQPYQTSTVAAHPRRSAEDYFYATYHAG